MQHPTLMSWRTSESWARHMSCSARPAPVVRWSTLSMRRVSPPISRVVHDSTLSAQLPADDDALYTMARTLVPFLSSNGSCCQAVVDFCTLYNPVTNQLIPIYPAKVLKMR